MILRIIAIAFIYVCTTIAWFSLGGVVQHRTNTQDYKLRHAVGQLWGTVQEQRAPEVYYEVKTPRKVERARGGETVTETKMDVVSYSVPLEGAAVDVKLELDQRKKGLLWYSTYRVGFTGVYKIKNPTDTTRLMKFRFSFPSSGSVYDDFQFKVGGRDESNVELMSGELMHSVILAPQQTETLTVTYKTRGMSTWWYNFGDNVKQVKNFNLKMETDFDAIDFPDSSISPTQKDKVEGGWVLKWNYNNLLTGVKIGLSMPQKLNPGPWVSEITFSAPISLFLFFFLVFVFSTIREIKLHPMNYFFLGAAFFSFHLLLSYMVDHISIHAAFFIASAVSIFLVVSYMRLVVGAKMAFIEIGLSQFVYLVLFSYTFFFEGYTGLVITILCIVTLFIIMQVTGRIDWDEVFQRNGRKQGGRLTPDFKIS